ncbi:MAG: 7-cyano-7-deazaguanine synthase [Endomicrobiaceae bacterium]|nr:7-cyano-7-deazaguanine synthase [Endomicrobiaceae bacterium]
MYQKKETAIMFSGGLDSTAVACELLKQGHKLHLLAFNNGVCIRISRPSERAKDLAEKFNKENINYKLIESQKTMKFLKNNSKGIISKCKSPLIFDLICRFSMEINTIIYCKKNNINTVADGNSMAQGQIFIQQKPYLDVVDDFYKQYDINSTHPLYFSAKTRDANLKILSDSGLDKGNKLFEKLSISSQLLNQPFCLWAPMAFLFTSPVRKLGFEKLFGLSTEKAIEIRKNLQNIARKYIEENLRAK